MKTTGSTCFDRMTAVVGAAVVAGTFALAAAPTPAAADSWRRDGWRDHRPPHHHHHGPVIVRRGPPIYYAPPPRVIYAPPPSAYVYNPAPYYVAPAPVISFGFSGRF